MNQSQYAKRIGVSRAHINKLVKAKIIPLRNGEIDPEEADQILIEHRHPSYDHNRKASLPFEDEGAPPAGRDPETPPADLPEGAGVDPAAVPIHQSRAVKLYFEALSAKLDFEEKSGNLVDAKKVEEQAFDIWRNYRDTWLNVPAKWSGEGAAELGLDANTGQEQLFVFLNKIIDKTLEDFADGPCQPQHLPDRCA